MVVNVGLHKDEEFLNCEGIVSLSRGILRNGLV